MEHIKELSFLFCAMYLGYMGAIWTTKDTVNQFFKVLHLGSFIFSTMIFVTWLRNGVWFSWFMGIPVSIALIFGLIFLFAKGSGSSALFTKLFGLISIVFAITYFTI